MSAGFFEGYEDLFFLSNLKAYRRCLPESGSVLENDGVDAARFKVVMCLYIMLVVRLRLISLTLKERFGY